MSLKLKLRLIVHCEIVKRSNVTLLCEAHSDCRPPSHSLEFLTWKMGNMSRNLKYICSLTADLVIQSS